jgi:hypothetical protein
MGSSYMKYRRSQRNFKEQNEKLEILCRNECKASLQIVKILLLGESGAGISTIRKQMKVSLLKLKFDIS